MTTPPRSAIIQSRVNPFCHRVSADFSPRKRGWLYQSAGERGCGLK
nr:MAG TPA: hypothetical protein [Caudoviricetes sp.]